MRYLHSTSVSILIAVIIFVAQCICRADNVSAADRQIKGPYNIEADLLSYDSETETYHASGNVIITFRNGLAKADSITINRQTGDSRAEGNVYIKMDNDILEGELALFNLDEQTGTVYNGRVFFAKNHLYLKGDEIEKKGEAQYSLKNANATTCDGDNPAWRITAREIDVTVDGYGTLRHGTFQVKDTPVLYLPWFLFPAKTTRQSGLLYPHLAYSSDNGIDIEIPFYWAISESSDATLFQRYISERGYKQGMEYRYSPSRTTFGTIYADYIRDHKDVTETVDSLSRDWRESRNRWSYYINHETTFSPGFYVRTDLKRVSDHWYFRDFSDFNYYLENYSRNQTRRFEKVSFLGNQSLTALDSTARLVKSSGFFNFTALGQYTDDMRFNNNDATLQRYPELAFTAIRQPMGKSGFNFEMASQYDYFYRNVGEKGHYGDIYPLVSRPLSFGDYVQMTPFTGVRGTFWDSSGEAGIPDKQDGRKILVAGSAASTEAYRIYNFSNKGPGLEKIRHAVRPEVVYTYAAADNAERPDYVPDIDSSNKIVYSLSNFLTTRSRGKDGKPVYREVFRLKLSQSFDLKKAREDELPGSPSADEFGPIAIEGDLNPFGYLSYHVDAAYDQNSGHWIRSNHDVALSDGRGDTAVIGYRYTKGGSLGFDYLMQPGVITVNPGVQSAIRELNLAIRAKASKSLSLFYILRRNEVENVGLESTYGLEYVQQCWKAVVYYSDTVDDQKFIVLFSLLGLGDVGRVTAPGF